MPYLSAIICLETLQFLLQSKHPILFRLRRPFISWPKSHSVTRNLLKCNINYVSTSVTVTMIMPSCCGQYVWRYFFNVYSKINPNNFFFACSFSFLPKITLSPITIKENPLTYVPFFSAASETIKAYDIRILCRVLWRLT